MVSSHITDFVTTKPPAPNFILPIKLALYFGKNGDNILKMSWQSI